MLHILLLKKKPPGKQQQIQQEMQITELKEEKEYHIFTVCVCERKSALMCFEWELRVSYGACYYLQRVLINMFLNPCCSFLFAVLTDKVV